MIEFLVWIMLLFVFLILVVIVLPCIVILIDKIFYKDKRSFWELWRKF